MFKVTIAIGLVVAALASNPARAQNPGYIPPLGSSNSYSTNPGYIPPLGSSTITLPNQYQPPRTYTTQRFGNQSYTSDNYGNMYTTQRFGNQSYTSDSYGHTCTTQHLGNQSYTNCN